MRLSEYLAARGESHRSFSGRSRLPQSTVSDIAAGSDCRVSNAMKVIRASREAPAPDGGTVTWEDLTPPQERRVAAPAR